MSLSRKHYKEIASIIKDNTIFEREEFIAINDFNLIDDLCRYFKRDNNRFDNDRFVNACINKEMLK